MPSQSYLPILCVSPGGIAEVGAVSCKLIRWAVFAGALMILLFGSPACREQQADGKRPTVSGRKSIENKGSDTLVNLALAWAEHYMQEHPEVRISVTGGGSGTGIASLMNGTADIANASREMKAEEIRAAQANGIRPVEFVVARDAIAVVVNPSNPVSALTLQLRGHCVSSASGLRPAL